MDQSVLSSAYCEILGGQPQACQNVGSCATFRKLRSEGEGTGIGREFDIIFVILNIVVAGGLISFPLMGLFH